MPEVLGSICVTSKYKQFIMVKFKKKIEGEWGAWEVWRDEQGKGCRKGKEDSAITVFQINILGKEKRSRGRVQLTHETFGLGKLEAQSESTPCKSQGGRGFSAGGDLIKHGVLGKPPHHPDEEKEDEDGKADFRGRSLHDYRKRWVRLKTKFSWVEKLTESSGTPGTQSGVSKYLEISKSKGWWEGFQLTGEQPN